MGRTLRSLYMEITWNFFEECVLHLFLVSLAIRERNKNGGSEHAVGIIFRMLKMFGSSQ